MRYFNTTGPVVAAVHYCIPPLERVNLRELWPLFGRGVIWYVDADGGLNVVKLLAAFQEFFREHSEHWVQRFDYLEAGPQLLLQAFLQRVVNGGGCIEREYGLGRGRTDLLIVWPQGVATRRFVVECKMLHRSLEQTVHDGLAQTAAYMDRCGAEEGHLVLFDRTEGKPWADTSCSAGRSRWAAGRSRCGGCEPSSHLLAGREG